ncbi:MAG TPA: SRPBCC family protein [Mycobacteriales bacterium]|jgi:uncharacterized membrane protein|nr:SRPBCC family protein [Mycobacteriales bacterium]
MTKDHARDRLTTGLGWASLGLGLPLLLRPDDVTARVGAGVGDSQRTAALAVGARELLAAAGLLRRPGPGLLWARVLGDAVDLALLGRALQRPALPARVRRFGTATRTDDRQRALTATAAVAGITLVDLYAAVSRSRGGSASELRAVTTVAKPPREVYDFWRQLSNLPTFMAHLDTVRVTGDRTSRWTATAPFGTKVDWDAVITEDLPGQRLSWRSEPGSRIANEGTVRFLRAPGDRGTEVHVSLRYSAPGGRLGKALARYAGEEPHQMLDDDLRRLKQVLETGEVVRSDGAPGGKRARREFPQHAAQPLTARELKKEGLR